MILIIIHNKYIKLYYTQCFSAPLQNINDFNYLMLIAT